MFDKNKQMAWRWKEWFAKSKSKDGSLGLELP